MCGGAYIHMHTCDTHSLSFSLSLSLSLSLCLAHTQACTHTRMRARMNIRLRVSDFSRISETSKTTPCAGGAWATCTITATAF